ncbi:grass carp reovirus (GCRV)-induced gene 2p [Tachysurus fulvidraco]|uniref:grass carp reovirus (GCRV)-induced gene 2p n=1 Tax=Tachysurus fulvidraco TaxID=1234273 RepID=UPI000F5027ED|nr:grass carp reovirus (GCRV)-induced gene 2p [Tachysurus fulvidraco]XP_027034510.1 grass carp reovirus (GCRV)-induced gene 2p [Tachysurus fulvidraco]
MSISFHGWEVHYDEGHHLRAEQEPKSGKYYTMYHGTKLQDARSIIQNGFRQSSDGMLGPGVYVSRNQKKAERYPLKCTFTERVVLKLNVDCGKIKKIDSDNHPMQKSWHANGYDTAWVPPHCGMKAVPSGMEEDCVWDPKRIKVIDIVLAPNSTVLNELKQLVTNQSPQASASSNPQVCQLCKLKIVPGHTVQPCWGCEETICTLMPKHKCNHRG